MDKSTRPPTTPLIVFVVGCTASGKASLSHRLALELGAEIVSIDSMKVYRQMDIGTAKPPREWQEQVKYHLIDVVDPCDSFSAARFVELSEAAIEDIHTRGRPVIGSGGTALYLKTLTEGMFAAPPSDPKLRQKLRLLAENQGPEFLHHRLQQVDVEAAQRIHPNDLRRIVRAIEVFELTGQPISRLQSQFGTLRNDYRMLFIGLRHDRDKINRRINARVKRMIEEGLVDEVEKLYRRRPPLSDQARQALGYAEIIDYLEKKYDLDTAIEKIKINTRRFAKSQRTWFRQMRHIEWFDVPQEGQPLDLVEPVRQRISGWIGKMNSQ
jgi:tRNA dimethylallyltransferase